MGDMRLYAAVVPPPVVLDELDALVRSVTPDARTRRRLTRTPDPRPAPTEGHHVGPRRGVIGRRTRTVADPDQVPPSKPLAPQSDQLSRLPVVRMHIPITTFGHLTRTDTVRLADELRETAATWSGPTMRFSGGKALEWPGDKSVWVRLDGDLKGLQVIAKGVTTVAQRLSLFVDRRQFRPWLAVGTINDLTTAPYLEQLVAALESFEGTSWTQGTVSLMKGQPEGAPGEPFEELEAMPLADS